MNTRWELAIAKAIEAPKPEKPWVNAHILEPPRKQYEIRFSVAAFFAPATLPHAPSPSSRLLRGAT